MHDQSSWYCRQHFRHAKALDACLESGDSRDHQIRSLLEEQVGLLSGFLILVLSILQTEPYLLSGIRTTKKYGLALHPVVRTLIHQRQVLTYSPSRGEKGGLLTRCQTGHSV